MSLDKGTDSPSLAALSQKIKAAKALQEEESNPQKPLSGDAARLAIDFASATAVGSALGYGLDLWLNSSPWGMIGGLCIGCAAGAKLMLEAEARTARKKAREAAKEQKTNI